MRMNFLYFKKLSITIFAFLAVLILGYYLGGQGKIRKEECPAPPVAKTESPIYTPKELGAGEVGEIKVKDEETGEEKQLVTAELPPVIFGTAGTIVEVKSDSLIIRGNGYNFADKAPRDLTCIFTDDTVTFTKNQLTQYKGKDGLKYLKGGMEILIESEENIRGKTEFKVRIVNIL